MLKSKWQRLFILFLAGCLIAVVAHYYWSATARPTAEQKALASRDALACAFLVARTIGSDFPEFLAEIATAHAKSGKCGEARNIIDSIQDRKFYDLSAIIRSRKLYGPDIAAWIAKTKALGLIALECRYCNQVRISEVAMSSFTRRMSEFDSFDNAQTVIEIAGEWVARGDLDQAVSLLELIPSAIRQCGGNDLMVEARKADGLIQIARRLPSKTHQQDALSVLSRALQQLNNVEDRSIRIRHWVEIAEEYAELKMWGEAKNLLLQAFETTTEMAQTVDRSELEQSIAEAYSKLGEFDVAIVLANRIQTDYKKGWALREIALQLIKANQFDRVTRLLPSLTDSNDNAQVVKALAIGHAEHADPDQAYKTAIAIPDLHYKADALIALAHRQATHGARQPAARLLQEATDAMNDRSRGSFSSGWERLAQIAIGQVEIGQREQAAQLFKQLAQQHGAGDILESAAIKLAELNHYDLAVEVANSITTGTLIDDAPDVPGKYYRAQALIRIGLRLAAINQNGNERQRAALQSIVSSLE